MVHLGRLVIDDSVRVKLHQKHSITFDDVVDAIQWPARAQAAWEDHELYGRRVVALGTNAAGRLVICVMKPIPEWDENADTWVIKTARWT